MSDENIDRSLEVLSVRSAGRLHILVAAEGSLQNPELLGDVRLTFHDSLLILVSVKKDLSLRLSRSVMIVTEIEKGTGKGKLLIHRIVQET